MQQQRVATVKVGLLTMISLAVLITTVIWLRGRSLGGGQSFEVFFRDVDGLREGAAVQFMGIRVGFVDTIVPVAVEKKQYRVHVKFTINDSGTQIPRGSVITLEQSGIIGEKYIEVTPPRPKVYQIDLDHEEPSIKADMPILVHFKTGLARVGEVTDVKLTKKAKLLSSSFQYRYQIRYVLDKPGYLAPSDTQLDLVEAPGKPAYFALPDPVALWQPEPDKTSYFTLEEPLRLKEFLDQQLASAEALKQTNQKINQLLSEEAIASIQGTLKNSEALTAKATKVLDQANVLFATTTKDLNSLVASAEQLTNSVTSVSNNINDIAGNPELKANIVKTVQSVQESTTALSVLLNDPSLKAVMSDAQVTSQNAAELMTYLKQTAVEGNLQGRVNNSLQLLESSLTRLETLMGSLEPVGKDKETIQGIVQDTRATTENLNKFSKKLNKHFLLFRLLF